MNQEITINDFSKHLFWDVDKPTFDLDKYKVQMISKILEFGNWNDWTLLKEYYGIQTIKAVSLYLRSLDPVTHNFLATIFNIDKTEFRCYKHKQLVQNCWNT